MSSVGILGIGAYLPELVRENDFWSEATVARWRAKNENFLPQVADGVTPSEGQLLTLEAMRLNRTDPFQGARKRHVLPEGMLASDMELQAAKQALAKANISVNDIDILFCQTTVPDHLGVNHATILHHKLGMKRDAMALVVDATCTSFLAQLKLAQQMIQAGTISRALLVQSSVLTRMVNNEEPHSAWFGDGSTAVVVGKVSESKGLLAARFETDGSVSKALVCGVQGKRWHDEGKVSVYAGDAKQAQRMILELPDSARSVVGELMQTANIKKESIEFYACHQPLAYARRLTQGYLGFENAKFVDSFAWTGNLGSSNIPIQLFVAEKEGMLRDGSLVGMFAAGSGMTIGAAFLRWGT